MGDVTASSSLDAGGSEAAPPKDTAPEDPLARWRRRITEAFRRPSTGVVGVTRDLTRWVAIAVPIGVVAGLGAALFYYLLNLASDLFLSTVAGLTLPMEGTTVPSLLQWGASYPRLFLVPAVMVLGGLAVGLIVWRLAPEVAGHGTDATIQAFHEGAGKVRYRVPLLKTLASVVTLGTGGSGGREGPVSQIGGGFGSFLSDLFGLSDRDRRIALATGMGAGIGAIFRAPLGGAVYSAEILYTGDFEPEVFVPAIIASVVAYSVYSTIFGFHTLFATPAALASYEFDPARLPLYGVLGIVCGAAGILFVRLYRRTDGWFGSRRWPAYLRPTVGAACAGAIFVGAYFLVPQENHFAALSSLTIGYGFVQAAMLGELSQGNFTLVVLSVLLVAIALRMVMTSFVVGSGGSAGLFGTSVVVGAFLGTIVGGAAHVLLPSLIPLPVVAVFSIVGMMSFFGGISKAPLGVLIMVVEMVGSYTVLPAAMVSIFVAYIVTGRNHIYQEQLPTRLQSPAHLEEYRNYLLGVTPIGALARQLSETVPPSTTVAAALDLAVAHGRVALSVDEGGSWHGAVYLNDLLAIPSERRARVAVGEIARPAELMLSSDLTAAEALKRMSEAGTNIAVVLSAEEPVHVVGLVSRQAIFAPESVSVTPDQR